MATSAINVVEHEFYHEPEKPVYMFSNNRTIKWKASYNSGSLYLSLLSGAASAKVCYFVYVEQYIEHMKTTHISSGVATLKRGDSADLDMWYYKSTRPVNNIRHKSYAEAKTFIKLCILSLNPVVKTPQESTLSAVLSATLDDNEGPNDVMLYFGPEKELVKASKFMLMSRSPVFKKMFEADMKEAESSQVTISDITAAVGKEMITYIYTDKTPNIKGMVEELWFAAEKYQLPGLKAQCENEIVIQLNTDNAAHFLLLAGRYCSNKSFKDYVLSFITADKKTCSKVMKSEKWKEVKKFPDLAFAVSDTFFGVPAEPAAKRAKCD